MDIIFISMENWDEVWRRNQFFCAEFSRRHPTAKILFVGLARDVTNAIRHRKLSDFREGLLTGPDGFANITVMRPLKLLPNSLRIGRWLNELLFRGHVRRMARRLGLVAPLLWINPHSASHLCGHLRERAVVYDITDDWTSLKQPPEVTDLVRRHDAELCRRADGVIVCSKRLFELKAPVVGERTKLTLIANGVDSDHYRCVFDGSSPIAPEASWWEKPVLGYVGTVHPERLDVALVAAMAEELQRRGGGSVVLVGPNHLQAPDMARLSGSNIHFIGPVPFSRVPEYIAGFDVCIVPHRATEFTESLNPIKLFEYMAAGKPIVATDVAGFRDASPWVKIARTAGEFVQTALESIKEDPSLPASRHEESRRHSWKARVDQVEEFIASLNAINVG